MKITRASVLQTFIVSMALLGSVICQPTYGDDVGVVRISSGPAPKQAGAATVNDNGSAAPGVVNATGVSVVNSQPQGNVVTVSNSPPVVTSTPNAGQYVGSARVEGAGPNVGFRHQTGGGMGVENGYSNIDLYVPLVYEAGYSALYADASAILTNDSQGGVNLGMVYATYSQALNRVFKMSGWWDLDNGAQRQYKQASVGFESLGDWLDFRIYGYIPVGDVENTLATSILPTARFEGNAILLQKASLVESAFRGFDTEIGGPLPLIGKYGMSGYLGAYYYTAKNDQNFGGVKVRFDTQVTEDWNMGLTVTDDRVFGTNVVLNVAVVIPDGKPSRWFRRLPTRDRMATRVVRNPRVTTHTQTQILDVPAINPVDGEPLLAVHFRPGAPAGGLGTYESPFNDFDPYNMWPAATRDQFDVLFVNGPGTLSDGVTLSDNQRLLSQARLHRFDAIGCGVLSTYNLPGYVPGSARPVLRLADGVAGDAIVYSASNNEVRGFVFDGTTDTADVFTTGIMTAPGAAVRGFSIRDNEFNTVVNGVVQSNTLGTAAVPAIGIFTDNVLNGNGRESVKGFSLVNSGGADLNLLVADNTVSNFLGEDADNDGILGPGEDTDVMNGVLDLGEGIVITSSGLGSFINAVPDPGMRNRGILDNVVTGNGTGLIVRTLMDGEVIATVEGNTFDNNIDLFTGFKAEADSGDITLLSLADMSVSGNAGNGVLLSALDTGSVTVPMSEDVNNNGILDTEDTNFNGILDPGEDTNGNGILDTEDVQAFGMIGYGVLDKGFTGNTVTNNGGTGVLAHANSGTVTAFIGSPDDLIPDDTIIGTNASPDNLITGNGIGVGMTIAPTEDANSNGILDMGEDTNLNGRLDLGGGTIFGGIFNNALDNTLNPTLNNNVGDIVQLNSDAGDIGVGLISLSGIDNNNMSNSGGDALSINTTNGGFVTSASISNNRFSNPMFHVISVDSNSGGVGLGIVENNTFDRTVRGTDGIRIIGRNSAISGRIIRNTFIGDPVANPNEDANNNGVLDAGEDLNNNGVLDVGVGVGVNVVARGGSVTMSIGEDDPMLPGASTFGNTFDRNVDASIALDVGGGALFAPDVTPNMSSFTIARNTITNTQPGVPTEDANNNGVLDAGEDLNGNGILDTEGFFDGDAISIRTSGSDTLLSGTTINNNSVTDSSRNGMQFLRADDARVDSTTISYNDILRNGRNGLDFVAFGSDMDLLNYDVMNNVIMNNTFRAIDIESGSDAQTEVDIMDNILTFNGLGGIRTDGNRSAGASTQPFGSGDAPTITGMWTNNLIADNTGPGIEILDVTTAFIGNGTEAGRNMIVRNMNGGGSVAASNGDGIYVQGAVNDVTIDLNTIAFNAGDGIDVNTILNHTLLGEIRRNEIHDNEGDGVELAAGFNSFNGSLGTNADPFRVVFNTISDNNGRGVDVMNRADADINLIVDDNIISSNGEEGLYVVNTSSMTQSQDVPSRDALPADGLVNEFPTIDIEVNRNIISDNGELNLTAPIDNGGINTNIGGVVVRVGTGRFSRVRSEFNDNAVFGNFGDDFYFESFTSTVDPPAVQGMFPVRTNAVASQDPLAQMDVVSFQGNTGDSILVTVAGAFYNNADAVFKSRVVGAAPPGPFQNAARRRNAQRRIGGVGNPLGDGITTPGFDGFEGTGLSTFRVESTFDDSGFTSGIGFITDIIQTGASPDVLIPLGAPFHTPFPTVDEFRFPFGWDGDSLSIGTVFP